MLTWVPLRRRVKKREKRGPQRLSTVSWFNEKEDVL